MSASWTNVASPSIKKFCCGFCGLEVASDKGYYSNNKIPNKADRGWILLCPQCEQPNYFCSEAQIPGPVPGRNVASVDEDVHDLFVEARTCVSVNAFTASVLASRKLLMNIAVNQGAPEGNTFKQYVNYLAENGYVPPNGGGWVDHIRNRGNEANHEIPAMSKEDALELITFSEMLLRFIYEFPARVPAPSQQSEPEA